MSLTTKFLPAAANIESTISISSATDLYESLCAIVIALLIKPGLTSNSSPMALTVSLKPPLRSSISPST